MRTQVIRKTVAGGLIRAALPAPMLTAALLLAVVVSAQETTMQVPQGSPVFPTIGQVDCLEEASSGRLCAATWACADGTSGELWGDMGNPDGRRTTAADSDIAIKRGCVVTVDGAAAVRWFSGFRPAGRTGDLLGVTEAPAAMRPVVRAAASGASGGLLLDYVAANHQLTPEAVVGGRCDHIRDDPEFARQKHDCWTGKLASLVDLALHEANPRTICAADLAKRSFDEHAFGSLQDAADLWAMFVGHFNSEAARLGGCAEANLRYRCCGPGRRGSLWPNDETYPADDFMACCERFEAEHVRLGITP